MMTNFDKQFETGLGNPLGISKATQEMIAEKLELSQDTKLGPIAKKAREEWPKLRVEFQDLPEIPPVADAELLKVLSFFVDADRTLTKPTEEIITFRKSLENTEQ